MKWIVEQKYFDDGKVQAKVVEDDGRIITPFVELENCDMYEDVFESEREARQFAKETLKA